MSFLFHNPKQILHPKHPRFPNKELSGGKGAHCESLAIKSLMGERDFVGRRLGHNAMDTVHLAFAGHFNI